MSVSAQSAYWPFDGSNTNPKALPLLEAPPTLSGADIASGSLFQPFTPAQAFELARNIKSLYLQAQLIVFDYIDNNSNTQTEQLSISNIVKRYQSIPDPSSAKSYANYTVCRTKFVAKQGSAGVVNFVLDFAPGYYGIHTVIGSTKKYMYMPKLTLSMAGNYGALLASASVTTNMIQWSGLTDNAIAPVYFNTFNVNPGITIEDAIISGNTGIIATERIDNIYFNTNAAKIGDNIKITCPPINSNFNTTNYRSGFVDVKQVWFTGSKIPVTTFTLTSSDNPVTTSSVLDTINIKVPIGAQSGPISFVAISDITQPNTSTDKYTTLASLSIVS